VISQIVMVGLDLVKRQTTGFVASLS